MKPWLLMLFLASCFDPKVGRVVRPGGVARPLHECGRQSAEVAGLVDAAVLLVMDRSRSMAEGSRWDETRAAVEVALAAYVRYLRFGLLLYPTEADMCGEVDTELAVPIGLDSGADIAAALADAEILRGTPTGAALRAAGEVLAEDRGERRVVILATDGRPDCTAGGWDNDTGLADVEAYDATNELAESGIPVYVIGIEGSAAAHAVLNRIADIGGTARAGDPAFYATNNGAEVAQALIDIALGVDGCTVPLEDHADAVRMDVMLDGAPLGPDPNAGWELVDERLRIHGVACLAPPGDSRQVDVVWFCE